MINIMYNYRRNQLFGLLFVLNCFQIINFCETFHQNRWFFMKMAQMRTNKLLPVTNVFIWISWKIALKNSIQFCLFRLFCLFYKSAIVAANEQHNVACIMLLVMSINAIYVEKCWFHAASSIMNQFSIQIAI